MFWWCLTELDRLKYRTIRFFYSKRGVAPWREFKVQNGFSISIERTTRSEATNEVRSWAKRLSVDGVISVWTTLMTESTLFRFDSIWLVGVEHNVSTLSTIKLTQILRYGIIQKRLISSDFVDWIEKVIEHKSRTNQQHSVLSRRRSRVRVPALPPLLPSFLVGWNFFSV